MLKVTIHEAKTHLSRLIRRALDGEEIIISRGKEPAVRLVPVSKSKSKRSIGDYAGKIKIAEDFDGPLDDFEAYR